MLNPQDCEAQGGHQVTLPDGRTDGTLPCERCGMVCIVTGDVPGVLTIKRPASQPADVVAPPPAAAPMKTTKATKPPRPPRKKKAAAADIGGV